MCVGWLSAMLTGHMTPFLEPLGPDKCIGSDNKLHDHSQDDQEGLECTQVGHLRRLGALRSILLSSFGRH